MKWLLFFGPLAVLGCSKVPHQSGSAPNNSTKNSAAISAKAEEPESKLSSIFKPEIIGANLKFLENITGPAFRSDESTNTYKVDGCDVIVGYSSGKIDNVGISNFGEKCNFNVLPFFASGDVKPLPMSPSFAQLSDNFPGRYTSDCLMSCGNASDPTVSLQYEGSHADNWNQLVAATDIVDGPASAGYDRWGGALRARFGDEYLVNQTYDCGENLNDVAEDAFGPIKQTSIRVGISLIASNNCKSATQVNQ